MSESTDSLIQTGIEGSPTLVDGGALDGIVSPHSSARGCGANVIEALSSAFQIVTDRLSPFDFEQYVTGLNSVATCAPQCA